jgi:hypothetical protein
MVSGRVFAVGRYRGAKTEVRYLKGVGPEVLLALKLPSGDCSEGDRTLSDWSMLLPAGAKDSAVERAVCRITVKQHFDRNHCDQR